MKKSRNRKSNIQSIEVKAKQPLSLPTGNESSPSESPFQEARNLYPGWSDEDIEEYLLERRKELQEYLEWARESRKLTQE